MGKEIARKGDYLFVTSNGRHTADLSVVDGFVEKTKNMKLSYSKRICVYRANLLF
ncbi:MAG TPA: hypothetical protein VIS28_04310 [Nitrososphaeraceae archaeon]